MIQVTEDALGSRKAGFGTPLGYSVGNLVLEVVSQPS